MAEILQCDICKRVETDELFNLVRVRRYKLKRENRYGWDNLDICRDCERELRAIVTNKEATNEK